MTLAGKNTNNAFAVAVNSNNYYESSDSGMPTGAGPFAVAAWFRQDQTGYNQPLITWGTQSSTNFMFLLTYGEAVKYSSYGTTLEGGYWSLNEWNHVMLSVDNTTGLSTLFLHGDIVAQDSIPTNIIDGGPLGIGVGGGLFNTGTQIASVRVWNVTQSEDVLYNLGIKGDYFGNLPSDQMEGLVLALDCNVVDRQNNMYDAINGLEFVPIGSPYLVRR